jgi:hypothetical protein
MAETMTDAKKEISVKDEYAKSAEVLEGFRKAKAHREELGWDNNAKKSMNYYFGEQWTKAQIEDLESQNRAPAVFNMILPATDLIIGHHIQNKINIVAKPVDEFSDPHIAHIINGAMKYVEQSNDIEFEDKMQFQDGIITGVGVKPVWWDTESSFEGKLCISQDPSWNYFLDANFTKYDYTDANELYRVAWFTIKDIQRLWGKKIAEKVKISNIGNDGMPEENAPSDFKGMSNDYGMRDFGISNEQYKMSYDAEKGLYRVIERYSVEWEEKEFYFDSEQNKWLDIDDLSEEEQYLVKGMSVKKSVKHIQLTTVVGIEAVEDKAMKCKEFYQLFNFYFPYFYNGFYMGLINNLFYPQDEINKRHSQIVHILGSIANSGMAYDEDAFDDEEEAELASKISRNGQLYKFKELYDKETGQKNYEMLQPHEAPQTYAMLIASEKDDVKYISGANDAIQGISKRAQSGRAKQSEIEQSAVRLQNIVHNFRKTQKLCGKAIVWWIQNYFTEEKLIRVMGDESMGTQEEIVINKRAFGQIFNDVTMGEYDITLEYEGRTQSERERNKFMLVELSNTVPQYADIISKWVLKLSDVPQKDDLLREFEMRQQMIQQQMAMGGMQPPGNQPTNVRPSRGVRRQPTALQ